EVDGERFEDELELLLRAHDAGHAIVEVTISTVHLDDNAGSQFRPVRDSVRVYARRWLATWPSSPEPWPPTGR
ncbi:MAG: hypothetical protein ACJ710_04925, partial [Ornithinibacter sp.]